MKNKIILCTVLFCVVSFFTWGYYNYAKKQNKIVQDETKEVIQNLKLSKNSDQLYKIITNTSLTTRNFIVEDTEGKVVTTLSLSNPVIEEPSYEIIHGKSRDWLAATSLPMSGTSMEHHSTTWYILDYDGNLHPIFEYHSEGHETPYVGNNNEYWNTEIVNDLKKDDSFVVIRTTHKICKSKVTESEEYDCKIESADDKYTANEDGIYPSDKMRFWLDYLSK